MPLKLDVTADGLKWLPFAKRKLAELKEWMRLSHIDQFSKHLFATNGDHIHMSAWLGGQLDFIRITAGNLIALYFGSVGSVVAPAFSSVVTPTGGSNATQQYTVTLNGNVIGTGSGSTTTVIAGAYPVDGTLTTTYDNYLTGAGISGDFVSGASVMTCTASVCTIDNSGISSSPVVSSPLWVAALAAADALNLSTNSAIFSDGMLNDLVRQAAETGHPTFAPPPSVIFADGETITVVQLEYAYGTGTSSFPPDDASISKVSIIGAKNYIYKASDASWSLVGSVKLFTTVAGVRTEVSRIDYDTSTNYGNIVFVSKSPIKDVIDGSGNSQFKTIYEAQQVVLKAVDPAVAPLTENKLLRAVQLAIA